jgi:hypothetical protein
MEAEARDRAGDSRDHSPASQLLRVMADDIERDMKGGA